MTANTNHAAVILLRLPIHIAFSPLSAVDSRKLVN
jgi:hypothetical protein